MTLEQTVDRLGKVRDQIALLQAEEETLRQELIDAEVQSVKGRRYRLLIVHSQYERVDYKGLIERLKPSKKLLASFTKQEERVQVRITSLRSNRLQEE